MTSRSGKNKRGASGFVKKSARFSVLRTNGTVSSSSSTFSRIKKCLRWSGVASSTSVPNSLSRVRRYVASFAASEAAMISASQEESATEGCFLLLQVIAARPYIKTCPDVE
eukprot:3611169-Pleurochrysis_carterae.AAC.1